MDILKSDRKVPDRQVKHNLKADGMTLVRPTSVRESYTSMVVIDHRAFIREALCNVLQEHIEQPILAISEVTQLETLAPHQNSPTTVVLYGAVYGVIEKCRTDLTHIRKHLDACRVCLLIDQLDGIYKSLFEEFDLHGLIPSSFDTEQLSACLKIIKAGVPFLPVSMPANSETGQEATEDNLSHFNDLLEKLTPRQQQVMRYIAVGRSNKYIAAELCLCESTIKVHVSELMKRLGATSRTHAVHLLNLKLKPAENSL